MEPEYSYSVFNTLAGIIVYAPDYKIITGFIVLAILLFASGIFSGSEVAYFSLGPDDLEKIRNDTGKRAKTVLKLYNIPERLLSTILIANNTINVALVLLAAFISSKLFDFSDSPLLGFLLEAVAITALLLFFGEILPKVYASKNNLKMALSMAFILSATERLCYPLATMLMRSTKLVKRRAVKRHRTEISMDDLSDAFELTSDDLMEDEKILKGILNFGNINVSAIMCPRIDVTAIDILLSFKEVIPLIIESGFSRIPAYSGSFDNVKGILYAKDVLPYMNNPGSFKWQTLLRPPYFVPETKKINDLLKEFQVNKIHMAIVIDEYGGTAGIITLEDILEEIVGEITDESDDEELLYRKIDEKTYTFAGKILLNDLNKILGFEEDPFEKVRGESETLAGLILELTGEIPKKGQVVNFNGFIFKIESADKRRIKEIRISISDEKPSH